MHDAVLVGVLQGLADGRHDGERLLRAEAGAAHGLAEVHPVHELHEQVEKAARFAEIVHGDNVRMIQCRQRPRLMGEALSEGGVLLLLGGQQLQRHEAVQRLLPCFVDHAHAATADAFEDLQLGEMWCQFLRGQRLLRRSHGQGGVMRGPHGQIHQADGAEAGLVAGGQLLSAAGTA